MLAGQPDVHAETPAGLVLGVRETGVDTSWFFRLGVEEVTSVTVVLITATAWLHHRKVAMTKK